MTDEELIARLRSDHPDYLTTAAADRIDALVRERAAAYAQGYGDCEAEISLTEIGRTNEFLHRQIAKWKARAERMEAALRKIAEGNFIGRAEGYAFAALKGSDHAST